MAWELEEALQYYKKQGAPADQSALVELLKEIQKENGGAVPLWAVSGAARAYGIKESFLLAIIRRIPRLRLEDSHCLEICTGPNCPKRKNLGAFVEKTYGSSPEKFRIQYTGCMRMCGRGPNIRWDGVLYNGADEQLIRSLVEKLP